MVKAIPPTLILLLAMLLAGCVRPHIMPMGLEGIDRSRLPAADLSLDIPGLGPCSDIADRRIHVNSNAPVAILIHGCYGSAGRLQSLSQVFAFHGQQSICFSYNDRDSLEKSSAELITALNRLSAAAKDAPVTLIGHSQGGLIGRRAVIEQRPDQRAVETPPPHLITVSTPFAGIAAARPCGSRLTHFLTLGTTVAICKIISGDKWWEITAASDFIQQPGDLAPQVQRHLKIITDERDTCRVRNDRGRCISRDGIFGIEEQYHPPVDRSHAVTNVQVAAGHVEIIGVEGQPPVKLIEILQREGILNVTPVERTKALQRLLAALY